MTTNRDLLEAQSWERRRLLTTYVTGDADACPRGQLRPLVAGLLLAASGLGAWAAWPHLAGYS